MIQEYKKVWKVFAISMIWLFGLLWPLLGIHEGGVLTFANTFKVWFYIFIASVICLQIYVMKKSGALDGISSSFGSAKEKISSARKRMIRSLASPINIMPTAQRRISA